MPPSLDALGHGVSADGVILSHECPVVAAVSLVPYTAASRVADMVGMESRSIQTVAKLGLGMRRRPARAPLPMLYTGCGDAVVSFVSLHRCIGTPQENGPTGLGNNAILCLVCCAFMQLGLVSISAG